MAKICLCLTAKTLERNLEILEKYRKHVDIAELRVDCLDPDERFHIRRFPEMAGLPIILTVRRVMDGGKYSGHEGTRISLLAMGLAFAEADRRNNFAYVDLEEDLNVPSLEEAARAFGTRIIRSYHNMQGLDINLAEKLRSLRWVGDEIVKASIMPRSLDDVRLIYQTARETKDMEKILLCMGDYGVNTRILAEYIGSHLSYTTVRGESDIPLASPGQLDPRELGELYRFRELSPKTKIFAVTGLPLTELKGPNFFNSVFEIEKDDAVFIPIPSDSIRSLLLLGEEMGISGISIAAPLKETVLPFLVYKAKNVNSIGTCTTIIPSFYGWKGYNTEAEAFSDSLIEFSGLKNLKGIKICIIGAGGIAKVAAEEVYRLNGEALILNRTATKAGELASLYDFAWSGLESSYGIELMKRYTDIIIQATPLGMEPYTEDDPLSFYKFSGRELVIDMIYNPIKTRCLQRAEEAGCKTLSGYDILLRQARYQYRYFTKKEFPPSIIKRVEM